MNTVVMNRIRHAEVVIPARDEQETMAACLDSVHRSIRGLRNECAQVSAGVTVVLDSCSDRTADIVARSGDRRVSGIFGSVGEARRAGSADALARMQRRGIAARTVWLANTDADTEVPEDWLSVQIALADNGADAVIGTVTPMGLSPDVDRLWHDRHQLKEGHDHVHGANLGLRADVYVAAGGFTDLAVDEDRDLVRRVKAVSARWIATHRTNVSTSGRAQSRVDGGFASYVADLAGGATCA